MTTPSDKDKRGPNPPAPGQTRPYPQPTKTGKIPFSHPTTGLEGETAYFLWGDLTTTTTTPLICLHGGPGIPHQYILPTCLIYADYGIPVLMYDQIGCGASTTFPSKKHDDTFWTPELFMAELENVISFFDIKDFDLLGQSWGAMLAGQFAIERQPRGLRKLVIEGGPSDIPSYARVGNKYRSQLPEDVKEVLDRCERENKTDSEEYKNAEMYYYSLHICRVIPFPSELLEAFGQLDVDSTVYETMMGQNEFNATGNLKEWSITNELGKITEKTCPGGLLVMNGEYDSVDDGSTAAFFYKPSCRVKWVHFGLSSHLPMLEETERFIKTLGLFLTSN